MRYFNTEGCCKPDEHYMVNLSDRLENIKKMYVDRKKYFVINRGRQYGKTTTLRTLEEYLKKDYVVLSLDFQEIGTIKFSNELSFSKAFAEKLHRSLRDTDVPEKEELVKELLKFKEKSEDVGLDDLFECIRRMCECSSRPIVLMIDEVDSASNNQVFLDFLAQLRAQYLKRDKLAAIHSVVLAGVYDIKNLKLKLRPSSEHQYNSPWNIAAKFKVNMSFSAKEIASMLEEYEKDYHIGMNITMIAKEIFEYTSGYPVLVSAVCKYIDEDLQAEVKNPRDAWSKEGIVSAVKNILIDDAPLFESMIRHMNDYPEMKQMFQAILFQGNEFAYSPDVKEINLACMFGYAAEKDGKVLIANRIFEMRLYNYFYSQEELTSAIVQVAKRDKNYFIHNGQLDMDLVMEKFVVYFHDIYGQNSEQFLENNGRKLFLLYLKPIINGVGNYYIETQTRDAKRTDIIIDYHGEQFIIEMKIWRGNEYNERGEQQLIDYLNYYHKEKGYLLSFNFNKKKETGVKKIEVNGKVIIEAVV